MRLHSVRRSDSDEIESCFYDLSRSFSESNTRRRARCVVVDYADVVVETVESLSQRDYLTCDYAGLVFLHRAYNVLREALDYAQHCKCLV